MPFLMNCLLQDKQTASQLMLRAEAQTVVLKQRTPQETLALGDQCPGVLGQLCDNGRADEKSVASTCKCMSELQRRG